MAAITLFVEDLPEAKSFYTRVFELTVMFEDENWVAFGFGNTVINLLKVQAAAELVASFRAPGGRIWEFAH